MAKATAAKVGTAGLGAKALVGGGIIASFAGRRALWPAMVVGGSFAGAAWFGAFEAVLSASKLVWPVPANQDTGAQLTGVATVPVTAGSILWVGSKLAPPMAPPPESIVDLTGMISFARSLPLKHIAASIGASAALSALGCRAVQYRGGA